MDADRMPLPNSFQKGLQTRQNLPALRRCALNDQKQTLQTMAIIHALAGLPAAAAQGREYPLPVQRKNILIVFQIQTVHH
jgi:hypothetical protein